MHPTRKQAAKKRTFFDDFNRRRLVRVRLVRRQVGADESDVDAAAFELVDKLQIARQRL